MEENVQFACDAVCRSVSIFWKTETDTLSIRKDLQKSLNEYIVPSLNWFQWQ